MGTRTHYQSCNLCEACCGIVIEVEDGRIRSIAGDPEDPLSRGYICPKATALQDIYEDPDRLRQPMRRVGSEWQPVSWDEAFDEVADRLDAIRTSYGRHAVGIYLGNPTVHSMGALLSGPLLLKALRSKNRFSATSADQLPHMLASLLMFGHQLLLPVPDVDRTQYFLMLGANPLASNGSLMTAPGIKRRLKDLKARGGKLVVIDPRRTETAALADQHLFIRPGTDALFLLALLHVLCEEGLTDLGRLASIIDGESRLRRLVKQYSPEQMAPITGIDAATVRQVAKELASAPSAACYGRVGVCTQEFGGLSAWLINVVNVVTGNLDQPGGAMFTTPAFDLVAALSRDPGHFAKWHSRVSGLPEFGGELPVSALAEEIETPGDMQIRALVTAAGNPVLSAPSGARLDSALASLEYMVSIDYYINETTRHAHMILPPTSALERDHYDIAFLALSVRNYAKYSRALFERSPDQRHDWEIAVELSTRLEAKKQKNPLGRALWRGAGTAIKRVGGPRAALAAGLRLGPHGRRGMSLKALEAAPHGIDLGPLESRLPGALRTKNRRIQLVPDEFEADLARLQAFMDADGGARGADPGQLVLIGRRQLRSNNSWMHNSERLVKGKPRCTLLLNPEDAAARGVKTGDSVRVSSRVGAVEVTAEVSDEIMPGVVSLPHGWGHHRAGTRLRVAQEHAGVSINDITDASFVDKLSGNAGFSGVPVDVVAVRAQAGESIPG